MRKIIILCVLLCAPAAAEPVVVAVDGTDIYVDLGAHDGVGAGAELELLHEVVAKDPRTGTVLRDRFPLGKLAVAKSGDRLSVAHADGELAKRVLAGDRVRLVTPARRFVDPWAERVAASRPMPSSPASPARAATSLDHVELARAAWQDTLGKSPEWRVARWVQLLDADPRTPYRTAIEREIGTLRAQIAARDAALAAARSVRADDRAPRIAKLAAQLAVPLGVEDGSDAPLVLSPIEAAIPGQAISLAFLVRQPARVGKAWLYLRPYGEPGFRRVPLVGDGDAYLRTTIDGALIKQDGVFWYVEVAPPGKDAVPQAVLGSAQRPHMIRVATEVAEGPIEQDRSHIDAHVDYVDFDGRLNKGFDQYYQAEIDFTYRFVEPVYAVRIGSGTLSGKGGPKDVIDADPTDSCRDESGAFQCRQVSFSYVYVEVEQRLRPNVAVMLRPQAGLLTTDVSEMTSRTRCSGSSIQDCKFATGLGGRIRLRLGDEAATNLVLGAGFTKGVGTLLEAAYNWRPNKVIPIQLAVQVTDQPVPEDFGVRLIADVGWRQLSWFYPSARLSYQARDIDHSGVSGGFAMNFDW